MTRLIAAREGVAPTIATAPARHRWTASPSLTVVPAMSNTTRSTCIDVNGGLPTLLRRQPLLEKSDEWRQHLLGRLEVRDMAETRQEQDAAVAVGDGPGEVLHPLLEPRRRAEQHVLGAAERERRHLDVRPVVDNRVGVEHLADQGLHHRQPWPVGAERPRVANASIGLEVRIPLLRVVSQVAAQAGPRALVVAL